MRIMTLGGLVLGMMHVDGHTTRLLFRGVVDLIVRARLGQAAQRQNLRDRRRQRRLAMVHVTDRADVHMRLGPLELLLCHFQLLLAFTILKNIFSQRHRDTKENVPTVS